MSFLGSIARHSHMISPLAKAQGGFSRRCLNESLQRASKSINKVSNSLSQTIRSRNICGSYGKEIRGSRYYSTVSVPPEFNRISLQSNSIQSSHRRHGENVLKPTRRTWRSQLFDESGEPTVSPAILRDSCKCHLCVDVSDKQRNFSYAEIPPNIKIQDHNEEPNGTFTIRWENDIPGFDNHVSKYSKDEITSLRRNASPETHAFQRRSQMIWDSNTFSNNTMKVSYDDFMNDDVSLALVLRLLWLHGLVFLDNVPKEASSVSQIVERIGPLRNTFYGSTWNVRSVPQAKNVAYTSKYLGFHMDLLYMNNPPGFQFLHCLENTCAGGESRFADAFKAASILDGDAPWAFDVLAKTPVRYQYSNDGFNYSDEKRTIKLRNMAPKARNLFSKNMQRPVEQIDAVYWSPPFVGAMRGFVTKRRHLEIKDFLEASKMFADILEKKEHVYETKMDPGTCAIFDNLRVVHARNAFDLNSGQRWLRGAYLDRQDFANKYVSLLDKIRRLDRKPEMDGSRVEVS